MSVSPVGGSAGISQLFQAYRQQVMAGGATGSATGASGATGAGSSTAASAPDPATAARSNDFASAVGNGLSDVEGLDRTAQGLATKAATGGLNEIQDYVIAATKAQVATELTTTVRNKAVDAFNEIMRMPL